MTFSPMGVDMKSHAKQKQTVALQGDLSIVTIENLMQLLGHAGLYGELQIRTSNNSAALFVHKGTLVYGHLENNPLRIGQRLIQGKYITPKQLQSCLSLCRGRLSRPRIGKILVEKKYLQREDLEKVHKEQSKAVFFEILSWQTGSFAFLVKRIPRNEDIFLQERLDHLTLEGVFHVDELTSPGKEAERNSISDLESVLCFS